MKKVNISELRRLYTKDGIVEVDLPEDPLELLQQWVGQAINSQALEPNAMSLATVKKDGHPDVRMVLLKDIGQDSISFYTNYDSGKAEDLENHPVAGCCFWWPELERQVRLKGEVEKTPAEMSKEYFASRPRESQIGAWASDQSSEVESREQLESQFRKYQTKFEGKEIPMPEHWGGYNVILSEIEFWQGRPGRLHDRIRYRMSGNRWERKRLAP